MFLFQPLSVALAARLVGKDSKVLYEINLRDSLKLAHKLTVHHLYKLKFTTKMKVKFAAHALSNSVYFALNLCVRHGYLSSTASSTSVKCKQFNYLFDILNSSSS